MLGMRLLTTLLLFIAAIGYTAAQDKFGSGFYVTDATDTVRGFIQYKPKYGSGFLFRAQADGTTENFSPDRVKSFGFFGGSTFDRVRYATVQGAAEEMVFALVLIDGEIDLLAYEGVYLLRSEEKGMFKLVKGKTPDTSLAIKNYQANTGAFNILFQDCPSVKEAAQEIPIKEERLVGLVKSYHQCRGLPFEDLREQKGEPVRQFGFFAGESFASISFKKPDLFPASSYLYGSDFGTSANPTAGVFALFSGGKPSSMLAFQTELVYTKATFNATYVYVNNLSDDYLIKQTTVTDLEYSRISLSGGLRITGRANKLHPYLALGVATQAFLSIESNVHQTTEINSSVETEEFEMSTDSMSLAAWAAAGIRWRLSGKKAIFLDINYEASTFPENGTIRTLASRIGFMF